MKAQAERAEEQPLEADNQVALSTDRSCHKPKELGTFEPEAQIFIENRNNGELAGFHVVTSLRLEDFSAPILANQGRVSNGKNPTSSVVGVFSGGGDEIGRVGKSSPYTMIKHGDAKTWGKGWPYLIIEYFSFHGSYSMLPHVIMQDPDSSTGFVRRARAVTTPEMNVGYAVPWFAFGLIALFSYFALSLVCLTPEAHDK